MNGWMDAHDGVRFVIFFNFMRNCFFALSSDL